MASPAPTDPLFVDWPTLRDTARRAFSPDQPDLRRLGWAAGLAAAFGLVWQGVRLGRKLDEVLFPEFRNRQIDEPVFIVANPRSGTTFLHRLMSLDPQFTHLKLYHTILPSVSIIRLIHAIDRLDDFLGGPLRAVMSGLEAAAFGGWEDIHQLGFARAEEDEGLFVLTLLSPGLYLLMHEIDEIEAPGLVDGLPEQLRGRLVAYYRDSIQRIMEAERADQCLLEKSVLISGRLQTMRQTFPEARFIHLVRHPYKTIPSFVNMFRAAWRAVSPSLADDSPSTRRIAELAIAYYKRMHRARADIGPAQMTTIGFDDLVSAPEETLERIYAWLDRPLRAEFRRAVRRELSRSTKYHSSHDYSLEQFGLTREFIADELADIFDAYGFER